MTGVTPEIANRRKPAVLHDQRFYCTFGVGQTFAEMYVEIVVPNDYFVEGTHDPIMIARGAMADAFVNKWSWFYTAEEFKDFQSKWHYKKLCTLAPNDKGYFRYAEDQQRTKELKAIELINRDMHMPGPLPGLAIDTMLAVREAIKHAV